MKRRKQCDMFYFNAVCDCPPCCHLLSSWALVWTACRLPSKQTHSIPQYDTETLPSHAVRCVASECSRKRAHSTRFLRFRRRHPTRLDNCEFHEALICLKTSARAKKSPTQLADDEISMWIAWGSRANSRKSILSAGVWLLSIMIDPRVYSFLDTFINCFVL